jgi:hypothetical protein
VDNADRGSRGGVPHRASRKRRVPNRLGDHGCATDADCSIYRLQFALAKARQISKQVKVRIDVATNIALGKELRSKREGAAALLEPRGGLRQMTVGWRGHDLGHGGAKVIAKPVRGSR